MSSRSTVTLKPFASKRCFFVCQQNLVVELYYSSKTDLKNLVGFPKATVKLQTIEDVQSKMDIKRISSKIEFSDGFYSVGIKLYSHEIRSPELLLVSSSRSKQQPNPWKETYRSKTRATIRPPTVTHGTSRHRKNKSPCPRNSVLARHQ